MTHPILSGVLLRVQDVEAEARFYSEHLGCSIRPAASQGWLQVDVGWGQSFVLAPGGRKLTRLADRWKQQGFIPILKTRELDREAACLEAAGVTWANRLIEYDMKGHGRLAYFHDPENHPIGVQERLSDSIRDEDLVTNRRLESDGTPSPRWLGIGWLICQVVNLHATRDFYVDAVGWPVERGTEGFGNMLRIDPYTMLQTAHSGRLLDSTRDVFRDDVLPVLSVSNVDALLASVRARGGSPVTGQHGYAAFVDPEGHAWLVNESHSQEAA